MVGNRGSLSTLEGPLAFLRHRKYSLCKLWEAFKGKKNPRLPGGDSNRSLHGIIKMCFYFFSPENKVIPQWMQN